MILSQLTIYFTLKTKIFIAKYYMFGSATCVVLSHVWWCHMYGSVICLVVTHVWQWHMLGSGTCLAVAHAW